MSKVFTFSTKSKKPEEEEIVKAVKDYCYKRNKNFSGLVVSLLKEFKKEHIDDRI